MQNATTEHDQPIGNEKPCAPAFVAELDFPQDAPSECGKLQGEG
jgi:hypothetical protein